MQVLLYSNVSAETHPHVARNQKARGKTRALPVIRNLRISSWNLNRP